MLAVSVPQIARLTVFVTLGLAERTMSMQRGHVAISSRGILTQWTLKYPHGAFREHKLYMSIVIS